MDSEKTCVMCRKREGVNLSTADRWYCQPCTDSLSPPEPSDGLRLEKAERLLKALVEAADRGDLIESEPTHYLPLIFDDIREFLKDA